jgi:hypothetical protein
MNNNSSYYNSIANAYASASASLSNRKKKKMSIANEGIKNNLPNFMNVNKIKINETNDKEKSNKNTNNNINDNTEFINIDNKENIKTRRSKNFSKVNDI